MNFEDITPKLILQRMLDRVPNNLDKRESSIIYNALAPVAMEVMEMYFEMNRIMLETFADTSSREYLILRAYERGLKPTPATNAILKGVFNIDIPIGARFSLGDLHYETIDKIADNQYRMVCESKGVIGNNNLGDLIPVEYIDGLENAELVELLIPGEDEESTESLRSRYLDSYNAQAFGGNKADYKEKTNSLPGVGGTKVYRAWNGPGTVKLVVIDSQYNRPTNELISQVQTAIDPTVNEGEGLGIAPIDHIVTVVPVGEELIHVTTDITCQEGYTWEDIKTNVETAIDNYFAELDGMWADNENLVVRISQIETRLLNLTGVLDIENTKINGMAENIILDKDAIPVRGEING
ncbi:MAG: baseplate J/gp47 family protein [Epulopiscium sp.]|nr:baseplate J/gp47 family protein [Candidatus Epulonipiscium sp.]